MIGHIFAGNYLQGTAVQSQMAINKRRRSTIYKPRSRALSYPSPMPARYTLPPSIQAEREKKFLCWKATKEPIPSSRKDPGQSIYKRKSFLQGPGLGVQEVSTCWAEGKVLISHLHFGDGLVSLGCGKFSNTSGDVSYTSNSLFFFFMRSYVQPSICPSLSFSLLHLSFLYFYTRFLFLLVLIVCLFLSKRTNEFLCALYIDKQEEAKHEQEAFRKLFPPSLIRETNEEKKNVRRKKRKTSKEISTQV